MAATSYDSLIGQVQPFCPGAPYPTMIFALSNAARVLCRRAKCWAEWQDVYLSANETIYSLDAPSNYATTRDIRYILINGRKLLPVSNNQLANTHAHLLTATGEPTHYLMDGEMGVRFLPQPTSQQNGLKASVYVTFVPTIDSTTIQPELIERFAETLILGAKANLMAMPNFPWSDNQAALYYKSQFDESVTKAEIEVMTDYGMSDMTVGVRRFGA